MPFFCRTILKSKNRSVTLQVRILKIKALISRKRVSLSASASLTLEAAIVLPLFLYAGVILMMPFRMMDIQRRVQAAAEYTSEAVGEAAYGSKYKEEQTIWNTAAAYAYAETAVRIRLEDLPVHRLSLLRSSLLEDGETIDLVMDYEIKMPFSVFGLNNVTQTVRSYRRAWVGLEGQTGGKENQEGDQIIVYIGKNSTRYHVNSTCHYLYNDLSSVPFAEIEYRRNQDGSRYSPCKRCGAEAASTVYIMPSGRHYHTSVSCSAINAYVKAVLKSEVEYLGACSYCSRGNGRADKKGE